MIKSSPKKQILSFSIFIILLAQISLDIFASNFRVSMGILLLPILVFLYQKIAIMPTILLAGIGAGVYRDAEDAVKRTYRVGKTVLPREEFRAQYDRTYQVYKELYPTLLPIYQKLKEDAL